MITAVAILGGIGLVFAVLIALANRKLRVWEDPRIDAVAAMLPNANCGACGVPGCRAFAELLVGGERQPSGCNVANDDQRTAIAAYLGVEAGQAVKVVARMHCAGGAHVAAQQAQYRGFPTCAAAAAVAGGGKGCAWGCLGLADCVAACTYGAMRMSDDGIPLVDVDACTACGKCVEPCPKGLLTLHPLDHRLLVQCRNLVAGDDALDACKVACTACGRCVLDAAPGLISVESGVAVVNYELNALAAPDAVGRCPTGAIVWMTRAQFENPSTLPARRSTLGIGAERSERGAWSAERGDALTETAQ
ncbi:Fe-S cluster domain protein (plasmid) [Gemmatirosa kalamazoonensis]|uniref:Ion-translocating oxidoreductase complex subunit B n=1 Tax=Gemmatirosa kalamazoonensis TaxID=861299 RepID=W0RNN6_9BACT|nr:(Fe-S)-binding protein [Gemmatirosa kalamazoonensis]AHG92619.1 Fe-S cluster domain protein [Gemmatirosa kalamazoonensis]